MKLRFIVVPAALLALACGGGGGTETGGNNGNGNGNGGGDSLDSEDDGGDALLATITGIDGIQEAHPVTL